MVKLLIVGAGGFVGAILRYGVSSAVQRYSGGGFPGGTLVVNALGCLIIGVLIALVENRSDATSVARMFVVVGLLGSFTTFSTFGHETIKLVEAGSVRLALWSVAANLVLGLGAVVLGRYAARSLGT